MAQVKVVILAAGKGKRMGAAVPKPLVEIAGKPMIAHLIERVAAAELNGKPVVIVSSDGKPFFEEALGDNVILTVQPEAKGTGDALRFAEEACVAEGAKQVIVLYGDHPFISAEALSELAKLTETHRDAVAMLTATVPSFEDIYSMFKSWGRILRDENGRVAGIKEAKDCTPDQLAIQEVNPGIYTFPLPWAFEQLKMLKNENASGEYYLTDLLKAAMEEGKKIVTAAVEPLEVIGVNTPEELKHAESLLTKTV